MCETLSNYLSVMVWGTLSKNEVIGPYFLRTKTSRAACTKECSAIFCCPSSKVIPKAWYSSWMVLLRTITLKYENIWIENPQSMDGQGWFNFMARMLSRINTVWLLFVRLYKRNSMPGSSSEHKRAYEQNKTSCCCNNSRHTARNSSKHEISIMLCCARTRETLRTSFRLIISFIESSTFSHFT